MVLELRDLDPAQRRPALHHLRVVMSENIWAAIERAQRELRENRVIVAVHPDDYESLVRALAQRSDLRAVIELREDRAVPAHQAYVFPADLAPPLPDPECTGCTTGGDLGADPQYENTIAYVRPGCPVHDDGGSE